MCVLSPGEGVGVDSGVEELFERSVVLNAEFVVPPARGGLRYAALIWVAVIVS